MTQFDSFEEFGTAIEESIRSLIPWDPEVGFGVNFIKGCLSELGVTDEQVEVWDPEGAESAVATYLKQAMEWPHRSRVRRAEARAEDLIREAQQAANMAAEVEAARVAAEEAEAARLLAEQEAQNNP